MIRCPSCGETLPPVCDAFCSYCQESLDSALAEDTHAHVKYDRGQEESTADRSWLTPLVMAFVAIMVNAGIVILSCVTLPSASSAAPITFAALLAYPFIIVGIVACVFSSVALILSCIEKNGEGILIASSTLAIIFLMLAFRLENIVYFFAR